MVRGMEEEETAGTVDRRREALLRKAKEYHKELDVLLVRTPANNHSP